MKFKPSCSLTTLVFDNPAEAASYAASFILDDLTFKVDSIDGKCIIEMVHTSDGFRFLEDLREFQVTQLYLTRAENRYLHAMNENFEISGNSFPEDY